MIRTRTKIYGERNDPNTVLGTNLTDQLVVGAGNKGVKTFAPGPTQLFIVNNGIISSVQLSPNKIIATNDNNEIVLIDSEEVL